MNRVAGKAAVVTAAGSGIGRATARRLAAEGIRADGGRAAELRGGADGQRLARYISPRGFCQPEVVSSLFAYGASDDAHDTTGSVVTMDRGITL